MRLSKKFYNRKTLTVARELLGKYLVRRMGRKTIVGMITETEAYCGSRDLASHASKGMTPRTKTMFGPPGRAYVYMIYGMYYCLNVVTEKDGYPAAVLIRGAEIGTSDKTQETSKKLNGPGKVCREFNIDKKLNGVDICRSREIWIENRNENIKPSHIKRGKRIGVDYAGKWKDKLWRFSIA
ncbi:MAG: 3-methyladenine DNA glycosylase [Candidatus Yanofskybacteria bacterium RIFCSPHIGHO2_01_FULL_41_27]|uniref:Putative 3-methyladenine DNA glycosylase n=1 Tax=Candidatus Yanofskybacteria bacterium RIFCSPHIGHO2_01_FULL_41_27 TaxID=1802662 RepID=A0A1F8EFC6_9BACT|nr:MAG: 3-methyladenine DNA glycosylase [Candidatus Yanofskybacteria bacterium RIFCSPHIGHO2_01_FULL_41_27]OGN08797.1 MAG: 3-methyladenine DNA glycosylase [Candidatus Yanofskybacteria bacterium RIFCSPHIGHO2_02_FULL_41_12]OGN20898.1 MAG: 3-methyladenine DNA glycosylase [Candidatus Yanofskybacteria bacterium RIFCSPLOWO2_01_FULL_41_33]